MLIEDVPACYTHDTINDSYVTMTHILNLIQSVDVLMKVKGNNNHKRRKLQHRSFFALTMPFAY